MMEGDESGLPDRGRFGFLQLLRHRRFTGNPLIHGLRLMFGPAAPEMAEFFKDLEDCWVGKFTAGKMKVDGLILEKIK